MKKFLVALYAFLTSSELGAVAADMPSGFHHGFVTRTLLMPYCNYAVTNDPEKVTDTSKERIADATVRFQLYALTDIVAADLIEKLCQAFFVEGVSKDFVYVDTKIFNIKLGGSQLIVDPDLSDEGHEVWTATQDVIFTYQWSLT